MYLEKTPKKPQSHGKRLSWEAVVAAPWKPLRSNKPEMSQKWSGVVRHSCGKGDGADVFSRTRSSDFHDSLMWLPCVVHQKSLWSPILTILIGGCVFRHGNLSSCILHCWWVHKLALLFLHLWDYKAFLCISKQKLTHFLMACGKEMKLEFGSFHFDNCYWYEV